MNEMAIIATRIRFRVRQNTFMIWTGFNPSSSPEMTAAKKQPVPVADNQLKSYLAASGLGLGTTGRARYTALCR